MPLTVRLTPRVEHVLRTLARRRRQTRSDVVRDAIEQYAAADPGPRDRYSYHQWADVVGIVRIGARKPRKTTGDQFADLIRRSRARRPR
jgi:Arc/MetJ-type ribon-helix-helix transcriptional regulator